MNSSLEDALLNFENRRFLDAERQCASALEAEPGNATVHVAGAIGLDVWTLVPEGTGQPWYWFLDRSDCLWYPSMKLFRQPNAEN